MGLKEISRNNMVLMGWLMKEVIEEILCYKIQRSLPNITSNNIRLCVLCPISVTNGMFPTPPWAINSDQIHAHL